MFKVISVITAVLTSWGVLWGLWDLGAQPLPTQIGIGGIILMVGLAVIAE